MNENIPCPESNQRLRVVWYGTNRTHRKYDIDEPPCYCYIAPWVPRVTHVRLVTLDLPAAEMLVQPPPV